MSTDNVAGELVQLNETLQDIAESLRTLANDRDFYPPALRPSDKEIRDAESYKEYLAEADCPDCPECEPCVDMDHQKGYE